MSHSAADARLYQVERWRTENLDIPLWHERTEHMVALLARYLHERGEGERALSILELGCGAMAAERALARHGLGHCRYLPADCFARDARTLVIDLEERVAVRALPAVDVLFVGGVLEYLSDPVGVLRELARHARYLFFSYCPRTAAQTPAERKGWKNHLTPAEVHALARELGSEHEHDASFSPRAPKPVETWFVVARGGRVRARCPGCGGRESEVAHVGELPLAGRRILQETRVCRACALVFERSEPDQDWAALYGDVWQRGALPSPAHRALYANDARVLGPGAGRTVFEIGCGCGLLLDELARSGWRTAGCDPEAAAIERARAHGHAVRCELFTPRPAERADLVVLGDVLEHQADPRAMLAAARAQVAPGGRLYVRVPDLEAIDFESFGDVFGLQHRVWFTRATLREFLASAGLELERGGTFGRGQHALARLVEPRAVQLPEGEPGKTLALVRSYSKALGARRARVATRLAGLRGRSVALYGGGEHAEELLAFSPLGALATRVVDGNPALWGKRCGGLAIEDPAALRRSPPDVVVIASRAYQDEIARELVDLAKSGVDVMALYPRGAA
jgi:2-polyprenyl-3-methyl-5-hydroxy-6-metoxy-1,4-benzoquinol methylase